MSRSRKKNPFVYYEKINKRYNNHRIRQSGLTEFSTPGAYKRYCVDWTWKRRWTKEDAIEQYYRDERVQQRYTLDQWIEYWKKCTIRK